MKQITKKKQIEILELQSTVTEMKILLAELNSFMQVEQRICEL